MLLKRFGSLWTFLPILDFNQYLWYSTWHEYDHDRSKSLNLAFFKFVRNVLMGHRMPNVTKFRIQFHNTYSLNIEELDSWIDFALRKNVEILDFRVDSMMYKLPYTVFVSDSITELKLEFIQMRLQTRVQMGLLRVLRAIQVDISDVVFQEIIRGCPLLKELEMNSCYSLSKLSFDALNVEKLILDTSERSSFRPIVDCPSLRSFRYTGCVTCIELKDLSSIVDVTFNFIPQHLEFKEFDQFMAALKPILSAKVVSLSTEFVNVLFYCMQKQPSDITMNWKRVELSMRLTKKHIPRLSRLLGNSPYLEELVIDVKSRNTYFLEPMESKLDNFGLDDKECSSRSLKTVVIYNSSRCRHPTLVQLVRILLKNASALTELMIHNKANEKSSKQWVKLCHKLPTFPKASQHVRVSLH